MTDILEPGAARDIVLENAPASLAYVAGSFVDLLVEEATFDAASCQVLEKALLALINAPALAAETDAYVFSIYRVVALQLLCHLNPNDVCGVENLDDDAVIDLKNRFDFVVGSYFFRERFDVEDWWLQWHTRGAGESHR